VKHLEAQSHMADYLEGDLDLTKRALLDAHLDTCGRCSQEFREMRGTIGLLRGLSDPEPPAFLAEAVMRRIREGETSLGFGGRFRAWVATLASPRIALPATALAVGLMMAFGVLDPVGLPGFDDDPAPGAVIRVVTRTGDSAAALPPMQVTSRKVPYLGTAPPAVARVPGISISLPIPAAGARVRAVTQVVSNDAARVPRRVPSWSTQANRTPSSALADPQALSLPVGSRTSSDRVGFAFAPQTWMVSDRTREARRDGELDRRIEDMVRRPILFAAEFSGLSVAEQEIWLSFLAERAQELGRGEEALGALRLRRDRQSEQLTTALAGELQRLQEGREIASLDGEGSASER
jgi:hypothetical protein